MLCIFNKKLEDFLVIVNNNIRLNFKKMILWMNLYYSYKTKLHEYIDYILYMNILIIFYK